MDATNRLMIAVPVALALIFVLLYFTFKSVKQSLMIFTAIPLSAIGGIVALYIRDMPFSISADVGFIALFGVAVLNGIVLIGQFNQLKKEGMDLYDRIIEGTKIRLRPVLLTAMVASLGFLPMALSTSAGAEVQKPLATVVIGGLITATILTLLVLPILYYYEEKGFGIGNKTKKVATASLLLLLGIGAQAQEVRKLTLEEALQISKENNKGIKAAELNTQAQKQMTATYLDLAKTEINTGFGYLDTKENTDISLSISQSFSPFTYGKKKKVLDKNYETAVLQQERAIIATEYAIRQAWENLLYAYSKALLLQEQAALLKDFSKSAKLRYDTGETTLMESNVASAKEQELNVLLAQNKTLINNETSKLKALLNLEEDFAPTHAVILYDKHDVDAFIDLSSNNSLQLAEKEVETIEANRKLQQSNLLPDFSLGYMIKSSSDTSIGAGGTPVTYGKDLRVPSYSIGISIPLFFGSQSSKIKAMKYEVQRATFQKEYLYKQVQENVQQQMDIINAQEKIIDYYQENALKNAGLIKDHAKKSYNNGDISYVEYIQSVETALGIQMNYLDAILQYNTSHNTLHYLVNQ